MSSSFYASQTTVYNSDVRSSTSTVDNITLIGCISSRADEALQKSDEHIRTLLNILLERSPETLYGILESLGAKDNNDEDYYNLAQRVAKMTTSNIPSYSISGSNWMLPIATNKMDADSIAEKITTEVFSKLHKVPFSALAQAACDHQPKAIKELFEELETICFQNRRHIDETSEPNDKYEVALQVRLAIVFVNVQYTNSFDS